jgi:molybdopterin synthase catalytic subunit
LDVAVPSPSGEPSAGGARDLVAIVSDAIDVAGAIRFVADERGGAIDIFIGCTRAQTRDDGASLVALDYEAFVPLATRQLHALAADARRRFPILRLALLHRVGTVALAEPSVLIAVCTPHRAESFAACRHLIDMLKREVAIWKRELWTAGPPTWVEA